MFVTDIHRSFLIENPTVFKPIITNYGAVVGVFTNNHIADSLKVAGENTNNGVFLFASCFTKQVNHS